MLISLLKNFSTQNAAVPSNLTPTGIACMCARNLHARLPALLQVKVESRPWVIELPSRKLEVELTTLSSNYHVEMNPSDVGNNDRYVVQVRRRQDYRGCFTMPEVPMHGCLKGHTHSHERAAQI